MRPRRGSALILVLLMTLAVAGLSIAAIFMSSSANLLSVFYDREREFRLAAESAIEQVRSRLERDPAFAVPDTGVRQVLAGAQIADAGGTAIPRVRVNLYAAVTGDTTGTGVPTVTLVAAAYDAGGTRYVRRLDLRRESYSRYAMFVDSFPSTMTHGPATVTGRVHSNGGWRLSASGNRYRDTVTAVGSVSGSGTFDVDSVVGVARVHYPADSTFPRLDSLAAAANLSFTPVTGGQRGSRLEFVAYDLDGDGTVEPQEGLARVFDIAATGGDTVNLRASPAVISFFGTPFNYWEDDIIQNQCGAFYLRSGRWHFFPVSAHRRTYVRNVLLSTPSDAYPTVSSGSMNQFDDYDLSAVTGILGQPTARCFPAGSPFLMPSERMTDASGNITGTAADTVPFGVVTPPGGWPAGAPLGYGGSDTTFTSGVQHCTIPAWSTGRCVAGSRFPVGNWRAFGGTPVGSAPDSVVQATELPYLWPLHPPYNTASRGVVSATTGPLYVSGRVAGPVTLRVAGRAGIVDELRSREDPNAATDACSDPFGLLATGDVLVVSGLTTRVRRISAGFGSSLSAHLGAAPRLALHGSFMSLGGTVGVEQPGQAMGSNAAQIPCPDDGPNSSNSGGGCLAVTGGLVMRTYSPIYDASTTNSGFRSLHATDRCQAAGERPPFFPLTSRYRFVRSLEVDASQANTPARIRALLLRLKGQPL